MTNSKAHRGLTALGAGCTLLFLIWKAPEAAQAAQEGIRLCLQTVIPSIFPFLVITRLLLASGAADRCAMVLGPVMGPLFHLPRAAASALVLGCIGGYPIGASAAASIYGDGALTKEETEQLLAFCSNAGPAFLFGMIGGLFGSQKTAAVLYGIHILSALVTGILLQANARNAGGRSLSAPRSRTGSFSVADAVRTMGVICGCIVLFRILGASLEMIPLLQKAPALRIGLQGILELAGGCCALPSIEAAGLRYCLASLFLAFGGLCVALQTRAVIAQYGLSGKYYLFGKAVQGAAAVILTWGVMVLFPDLLPRALPAANLPNHTGLLASTGAVTAVCLVLFGIWCIYLRNRAGNESRNAV